MKIKPLIQPDESACGPTSVLMSSNYFGCNYSFDDIAKTSQYIERDGLSDDDLVETLLKLGFSVRQRDTVHWSELKNANTDKSVVIVSESRHLL